MSLPSSVHPARTVRLSRENLRSFCQALLVRLGATPAGAYDVADSLVTANLRGVDSHGVQMLLTYVQQLRAGGVAAQAVGHVISESGGCLHYDGENGFGQVIAQRAVDHVIRLVRSHGLGLVVVRHSNHFGTGAGWGAQIARAGFIGIVMSNACPAVPPWQGRTPILGTNPLCVAAPGPAGTVAWIFDMATTTVALGKVTDAAYRQEPEIPAAWGFLDAEGRPTTQTAVAQRGLPTPVGGYKGTGLALMVEILCAGLSGGPMATELPVYRTGGDPLGISHTFLAIDPGRFLGAGEMGARMQRLAELVKASVPAAGYTEVLLAGEVEARCEAERSREGIPLPGMLWDRLVALAADVGIAVPAVTAV